MYALWNWFGATFIDCLILLSISICSHTEIVNLFHFRLKIYWKIVLIRMTMSVNERTYDFIVLFTCICIFVISQAWSRKFSKIMVEFIIHCVNGVILMHKRCPLPIGKCRPEYKLWVFFFYWRNLRRWIYAHVLETWDGFKM